MGRSSKPPYVNSYRDSRGAWRYVFRRKGHNGGTLPGKPWSPEFMEAYNAYLSEEPTKTQRVDRDTIEGLVTLYLASKHFQQLAAATRRTYRSYLRPMVKNYGRLKVAGLARRHVKAVMEKAESPSVANKRLRAFRLLIAFAIDLEIIERDVTDGISRLKEGTGARPWSEVEIERFRQHYAPGTTARLAFELFLHTGQRRSDVARLGWQHIEQNCLTLTQQKTGKRVAVPVLQVLAEEIERTQGKMLFLETAYGKARSADGLGNKFRQWCNAAGLEGFSAHGLRKAATQRLAYAGLSHAEIAGITGLSIKTVEVYLRGVDVLALAEQSRAKLTNAPATVSHLSLYATENK